MRRVLPLGSVAVAAALLLGGCGLLPSAPVLPTPAPPEQTDTPTTGAPAGWEALTHCDGAPEEPWVWVEGFPAAEFDASGAVADCGDIWPQEDGDTFAGIASYEISVEQLDAFGAELEASGYEELFDDFVPGTPAPGESYYGARDYYLDGIYEGISPASRSRSIRRTPIRSSGRHTSTSCRRRRASSASPRAVR